MDDMVFNLRMDEQEARLERLRRRVDDGGNRLGPSKALQARMAKATRMMNDLCPTKDKELIVWEPIHPSAWSRLLGWLRGVWGWGAPAERAQPQTNEPAPDRLVLFPQDPALQRLWRNHWREVCEEAQALSAATQKTHNEAVDWGQQLTETEQQAKQARTVRVPRLMSPMTVSARRRPKRWLSAPLRVIWHLVRRRTPTKRSEAQEFQNVTLKGIMDRKLPDVGPSQQRLNTAGVRLPQEWKALNRQVAELSQEIAELGKTIGG